MKTRVRRSNDDGCGRWQMGAVSETENVMTYWLLNARRRGNLGSVRC